MNVEQFRSFEFISGSQSLDYRLILINPSEIFLSHLIFYSRHNEKHSSNRIAMPEEGYGSKTFLESLTTA